MCESENEEILSKKIWGDRHGSLKEPTVSCIELCLSTGVRRQQGCAVDRQSCHVFRHVHHGTVVELPILLMSSNPIFSPLITRTSFPSATLADSTMPLWSDC